MEKIDNGLTTKVEVKKQALEAMKKQKEEEKQFLKEVNENLEEFFDKLIKSNGKNSVKIRYNAGSKPGSVREIIPHRINKTSGILYAHCIESQKNKSYYLNYVEVVGKNKFTRSESNNIIKGCVIVLIIILSIILYFWLF